MGVAGDIAPKMLFKKTATQKPITLRNVNFYNCVCQWHGGGGGVGAMEVGGGGPIVWIKLTFSIIFNAVSKSWE